MDFCARQFCAALDTDNFFIVAVSSETVSNVFHVEHETGHTTELLEHDSTAHPLAVAYDPTNKLVYWSDVRHKRIRRHSLIWRNSSTIYHDNAGWFFIFNQSINRLFLSCPVFTRHSYYRQVLLRRVLAMGILSVCPSATTRYGFSAR